MARVSSWLEPVVSGACKLNARLRWNEVVIGSGGGLIGD
jgi:hypothetical protein